MPRISDLPPTILPLDGSELVALVKAGITEKVANKLLPISTLAQAALNLKADLVGGLVPASQLPGFVDTILEFADVNAFPAIGTSATFYIALDTNTIYRWTGTQYVSTGGGASLALGSTATTAYRGDRGTIAYDHTLVTGNPHGSTFHTITTTGSTTTNSVSGKTEVLSDNSTKYATTAFVKGQNYTSSPAVFTLSSVPFANNLGQLTQDNTGLKYDGTNLFVGHINPAALTGIFINDSEASITASSTQLVLRVGDVGNATPDLTKSLLFNNQDVNYLTLNSSSSSVHSATFNANVLPSSNNTWNLGSSAVRWKDFYVINLNVSGTVTGIDKVDVGLANVDNTTDALKPISTATQAALDSLTTLVGTKINTSERGINNGVATLGADGKVLPAQLPTGSQVYKGTYNATTNTPALINGTGTSGWVYRVTVAGTQNFGAGAIVFTIGDDVIYNGSVWERIPSYSAINSVNGQTGTVVLTTDNVSEGTTNKYYTNAQARAALSATTPVSYNSSTGVISMAVATSSVNGYLSSTDWSIFNGKQGAGNYVTALTGDITASGPGSVAATIGTGVVTYAKIQNVSATNKVLGRITAGAGVVEEISTTGSGNVVRSTAPVIIAPTGIVKADVGLSAVDNTSDINKVVSIATQTALNLKADQTSISNIDNTSDINKAISTLTQTALNSKVDKVTVTNAQVGTTYTLLASDNTKVITISNASPITLTVPSGLGAGFSCLVIQLGAGAITLAASGTTINQRQGFTKTAGQYAALTIASYVANTFIAAGDMA